MADQKCIACSRCLKPSQRRTLRSSKAATAFLSGFERIEESAIRSSIRDSEVYMCKPCLKGLENENADLQRLDTLINRCCSHYCLPAITINAIEVLVEAEDSEEGKFAL